MFTTETAMHDGPEERTFENEEWIESMQDEIDRLEDRADTDYGDDLLDIAQARLTAHFLDKVFE